MIAAPGLDDEPARTPKQRLAIQSDKLGVTLGTVILTQSKWVYFQYWGKSYSGKTDNWEVRANERHTFLGFVRWRSTWRRYCFYPAADTVFEEDCLSDIAAFLREQTIQHKAKLKADKCAAS
jgi:hypothetical protein